MFYVLCFLFVWISWITITVMGSFLSCSGCGGCGVTFKKGNNSDADFFWGGGFWGELPFVVSSASASGSAFYFLWSVF